LAQSCKWTKSVLLHQRSFKPQGCWNWLLVLKKKKLRCSIHVAGKQGARREPWQLTLDLLTRIWRLDPLACVHFFFQ
jgi:hypothetical protein